MSCDHRSSQSFLDEDWDRRILTVVSEENVTALRGALGMSKERLHVVDCLISPVGPL
jgi:hypothetical protein